MAKVKYGLRLKGFTSRIERAARRDAVEAAADHILGVSQDLVPLREGVLQSTGKVTVSEGGLRAGISYDTVYARRQHEELTWRHAPGRIAKYLETPMMTERETALKIMAAVMRRSVR